MLLHLSRLNERRRSSSQVLVNAPLAASLALHHCRKGSSKAASVALRRSPKSVRTLLASPLVRRIRPDLGALALAAAGERTAGLDVLRAASDPVMSARRSQAKSLRRVAQAAAVLHDVPLARRALAAIDSERGVGGIGQRFGGALGRTRALVAAEAGHLSEAVAAVDSSTDLRSRSVAIRLRAQTEYLQARVLRAALRDVSVPARQPKSEVVHSVLHVVSNALPEQQVGYTIRTHGIVSAQRAIGTDAHVVSRLGYPVDVGFFGAQRDAEVDGVPYHRLLPHRPLPNTGGRRTALAAEELSRVVQMHSPDLLHAHSKHDNAQASLIVGRRVGLPVIYEVRGFLEETWRSYGGNERSDFYVWSRESETLCMHAADGVVALSAAMAHDIIDRGVDASKVSVVPNCVPEAFTIPVQQPTDVRTRLGIDGGATVFGTVSTLNDYEGLDTVIAALHQANDDGMVVLIVGDGVARAALELQAESLGAQVVFTGRVPHAQVREYLSAIDVFVVPRRSTPVTVLVPPIKPLEAMAVGKPVLASDLAPLVEIVRPGVFGAVAPAQDVVAWAEQMTALRYAPEHVRSLGQQAAEFVARERTWPRAADQYAKIYAAAVHR